MVPFSFARHEWYLLDSGAVYWPVKAALLVADLHLEKASFFATHGQFLPPYDSAETLARLAVALERTGATAVYCLGDNFHDASGRNRLPPNLALQLAALENQVDWHWIEGNHDRQRREQPPGAGPACTANPTGMGAIRVDGICLTHQADPLRQDAEVSGHFHPVVRVRARGRGVTRRCLIRSEGKLILPAFGCWTGGMDAGAPAVRAVLGSHYAEALVCQEQRLFIFALGS